MNIAALYMAAYGRPSWSVEEIRRYVVYTPPGENPQEQWFFDTFMLLDFKILSNGHNFALSTDQLKIDTSALPNYVETVEAAYKSHWLQLLDLYFGTNANPGGFLSRLDSCIANAKQTLGNPGFVHKVILCVPEPISEYVNPNDVGKRTPIFTDDNPHAKIWNDCDPSGTPPIIFKRIKTLGTLDFVNEHESCSSAVIQFINECLVRWQSANLQNLQLAGFYWINEGQPGLYSAFNTMLHVHDYLQEVNSENNTNLKLLFAPYRKIYHGVWTNNGGGIPYREQCPAFDLVFAQPNYSLGAGSDTVTTGVQYLLNTVALAESLDEEIVMEVDHLCLYGMSQAKHNRAKEYYSALNNKFFMNLLFYTGERFMGHIYDPANNRINSQVYQPTPQDYAFVNLMANFIMTRRMQIETFNRADVNEDGEVDIADQQIIINEMLGQPTGYGNRADVNQDGIIDITDFNQVSQVQLGNLSVGDPVVMFYDNFLSNLI